MMTTKTDPASFRDPSGFVFHDQDNIYRQVNLCYQHDYDFLIDSGLYDTLTQKQMLIPHKDADLSLAPAPAAYKVIQPRKLDFISYPYEWCFSQLKDAALLTLNILNISLDYGMILKDASAYNIQFDHAAPIFIDSLSFTKYEVGQPWPGYKQFCQHFLAPLLLMAKTDISLNQLLITNIDGIPLPLASKLLPRSNYFSFAAFMHIHMHAKFQQRYSNKTGPSKSATMPLSSLKGLISQLHSYISKLKLKHTATEWANYYTNTNYTDVGFQSKKAILENLLQKTAPRSVWDMGANTGEFSAIAAQQAKSVLSFDIDPNCIEAHYQKLKRDHNSNITPLIFDCVNPSPAIGWANSERHTLWGRGPCDTLLALALIHHLAISNNLSLEQIATLFAQQCRYLIIEFVPKGDSKVDVLLATRPDIFPNYTQNHFEQVFNVHFELIEKHSLPESKRTLYLYKTR